MIEVQLEEKEAQILKAALQEYVKTDWRLVSGGPIEDPRPIARTIIARIDDKLRPKD